MTTATVTPVETDPTATSDISDALALQQMEAGFSGTTFPSDTDQIVPTVDEEEGAEKGEGDEGEAVVSDEAKVETAAAATDTTEPAAAVESVDPAEVKKALELLQAIPNLQSTIEKLRGDAFGKIGGIERILKTLQETTPLGQPIEVSADDFEELREEFPETAKKLAPALTRILKKVRGTGTAVPPQIDENALIERASKIADEIADRRVSVRLLTRDHKDWREVAGDEGSNTPFRQWVKKQGPEVEKAVFSSWDPDLLSEKLTTFKKEQEKAAKGKTITTTAQPNARAQRLAEAVQPRGSVKPPAPKAKTAEEQFEEGFNSGPGGSTK